ncbi:MAG: C10 family peptidase [Muribaculaceae bacterium]
MKNLNRIIAITPFIALAVSLGACNSDEPVSSPEAVFNAPIARAVPKVGASKLDPTIVELDAADAATVADIYLNSRAISHSGAPKTVLRSGNAKTVKNMVAINDSSGNPAIYAVNFEDGYIMVSATQKYFPVLAEVEYGTFTLDVLKETGMEVVVDEMLANIEIARSGKYDFKARTYWRDYVDNGDSRMRQSRLRASDDYWEEYDRWLNSDGVYGNNVYYLHDCFDNEILPEDVYNSYVRAAQDEDLWEGTDYSWWWTAYVVEKKTSTFETHGPLLTTKWHQDKPYNTTGKDFLGCVTIATAQLMKYFRHPLTFKWDNMPDRIKDSSDSPDLTSFLAGLSDELKVSQGGGSNIGEAKRVLQNYGYNVTEIKHDDSKIIASLKKDYPVYARGGDANGGAGHAWVIDGLEYSTSLTEYVLYRLADHYYPDFRYEEAQSYERYQEYSSVIRYHYNWGGGGSQDGWFIYYAIPTFIDSSNKICEFTKDRKELIINNYR